MTYKPASVKTDVKMICCLRVTRRRQRSGIGFPLSSVRECTKIRQGAYQYKYYSVEADVRDAFPYKECMEIDT